MPSTAATGHPRRHAGVLDLQRMLPLAGATVLLLFGLFCVWQTWLIARESGADQQVRSAQRAAAQSLTAAVKLERSAIDRSLADPQLQAALAAGDAPGRAAAAARAGQLLPQARAIEFFSAPLDEVLHANYHQFGYAKASQLVNAQTSDARPPMETMRRHDQRRLTLARPIRAGHGQLLGYAWLELPFAPLQRRFDSFDPGAGRLELRQGDGHGDVLLVANGSNAAQSTQGPGLPVDGSTLWVVAAMPPAYVVLPRPWPLTALLALLALAGGSVLLWLRARSRASLVRPEEETILSDITSDATASSPSAAPLPAPSSAGISVASGAAVVERSIFRAYDIRGVVGTTITADTARLLGQAIGSVMREKGLREIVVGRDGRLSGPELASALSDGLRAAGIDVIDVGAVPTPLVYFAVYHFNTGSGVAVTGSHNPPDYNGFKIVIGGETLAEDAIQELYLRIVEGRLTSDGGGSLRRMDMLPEYLERVSADIQVERRLKVVADSGNGIAGAVAPQLLEAIGCEVIPLYCEVDGHFPNHHPDPSDPHNLEDLILAVKQTGADLGVAFDGDGDRLGVVTRDGEIIYADRLLMLFASDVLERNPGAMIVYDVKCTGRLPGHILRHGGSPLMWKTGHSLIKAKMRETEAELAGEMSGHFFFAERWYGFDDGIYAAARLLEILAAKPETPSEQLKALPNGVSTPEIKVDAPNSDPHTFVDRFQGQAKFEGGRLSTIDGLRVDWPDGWGLVRASNTTPVLVMRFDADSAEALARMQAAFREQLLAVDPQLVLPF
jgi:phosphomannomutase/phosphoglucomutase